MADFLRALMPLAAPEASGIFLRSNRIVGSLAMMVYTSGEITRTNKNAMEIVDESMALPNPRMA
jgi:hypothetical protein